MSVEQRDFDERHLGEPLPYVYDHEADADQWRARGSGTGVLWFLAAALIALLIASAFFREATGGLW